MRIIFALTCDLTFCELCSLQLAVHRETCSRKHSLHINFESKSFVVDNHMMSLSHIKK